MNIMCAYERGNLQADLLTKGVQGLGHHARISSLNLPTGPQKTRDMYPVDVVHVYNDPLTSDLSVLDLATDGIYASFIQYNTSDLRTHSEAIRLNPYANIDSNYHDESVMSRLHHLSQRYPACIVKNHEAAQYAIQYHRRIYIVPYAIDLKRIDAVPTPSLPSHSVPLIVHPCLDESKGTEFIEDAMNQLRQKGYRFDYLRVQNSIHAEALRTMREADIIIDQVLHGSFGITSIEAMALGKPVISHIRPDLSYKYTPTLPVISANPATLSRTLVPFLEDAGIRKKVGQAGREYVEKHHHIDAVSNKLIWAYRNEMDYLKESLNLDQGIIFDSLTRNSIVIDEDTTENDFAPQVTLMSSPSNQDNPFTNGRTTDDTAVMDTADVDVQKKTVNVDVEVETTDVSGEMENSTSYEQDQLAIPDSTKYNPVVREERTEKIEGQLQNKYNKPHKQRHNDIAEPMTTPTVQPCRPNRFGARSKSKNTCSSSVPRVWSNMQLPITKSVKMAPFVPTKKKLTVIRIRYKRNWISKRNPLILLSNRPCKKRKRIMRCYICFKHASCCNQVRHIRPNRCSVRKQSKVNPSPVSCFIVKDGLQVHHTNHRVSSPRQLKKQTRLVEKYLSVLQNSFN